MLAPDVFFTSSGVLEKQDGVFDGDFDKKEYDYTQTPYCVALKLF